MSFYEEYKPFRNYMRRFGLVPGLVDVWCYLRHIMDGEPLPKDYALGMDPFRTGPLKEHLYPWDLDLLAKELLLNAGANAERSLRRWSDLAVAINHLRRLDDVAFERGSPEQVDVIFELHRIAHRQFPWQMKFDAGSMIRAFKVFGEAAVEKIVVRELGMTTKQFLLLGMAVSGHFQNKWGMSTNQDYSVLRISKDASTAFLKRIVGSARQLRVEITRHQSYDRDWLYSWNPLEATPLVSIDDSFPDRVLCPIPYYLRRRVSGGIFYDLVKASDFDNPFGNSFQAYIGEVIAVTSSPSKFKIRGEEPYYVGANKLHGVDWIVSDATGHLFIEAKTKRLTVNARTLSDAIALDRDLTVMATAIVQHYRNIRDALDGKTKWQPDGRPIYPIVLTLEDWLILSPRVNEMLLNHVCRLLGEADLPERVVDEMPYTIMPAREFEVVNQIIDKVGISAVLAEKAAEGPHKRWTVLPYVQEKFKDEMRSVNWHLFAEDWQRLLPDAVNAQVMLPTPQSWQNEVE